MRGPIRSAAALLAGLLWAGTAWAEPGDAGKLSLWTAEPSLTPVSDYTGDLWHRTTMFGDVDQRRQWLYEKGFALDFELTQAPQGVVSGGRTEDWEYSGLAEYKLGLDSGRLGLWPGGMVGMTAVSKFGDSIFRESGNLMPANFNYLLPNASPGSDTFLEEYYAYQGLTDWLVVLAGRVMVTNLADRNAFANNAKTQFLNAALRNNALLLSFTAISTHAAGVVVQPSESVGIAGLVISANDEDGVYGSPGGLFSEVTAGGEIDLAWKLGGLEGHARPIGLYTTRNPLALDNEFFFRDVILGIPFGTADDNWTVGINLDQYLYMPEGGDRATMHTADFDANPEGLGVFFRFGYTPEDRNPFNTFLSGGFGGRGVVPGRPDDRYGLGFYAALASDELRNVPILRRLDTEWGMELFYNVALTPWLQFTPDLQYIRSGLPGVHDSVVLSFRVQIYI